MATPQRESGNNQSSEVNPDREALQLHEDGRQSPASYSIGTSSNHARQSRLARFWTHTIALSVPHDGCRDHWANERMALGYFRTAQAFAILGVVIAQLMRLNTTDHPDPNLGYFRVSVPLASCCHLTAIIVTVVGTWRFFHWQHEMATGYSISSGWELLLIFILSLMITTATFILCLTISIERSNAG